MSRNFVRSTARTALLLAIASATLVIGATQASAQFGFGVFQRNNQEIWVSFANNSSRTVTFYTADGENLGTARPGQRSNQIDFTNGERVAAYDAQARQWVGRAYVVRSSANVSLTNNGWVDNAQPQRQIQLPQLPFGIGGGQGGGQGGNQGGQGGGQVRPPVQNVDPATVARETITYLNQLRVAKGLKPFAIDARLMAAADRRAKSMGAQSQHGLDISPAHSHFFLDDGKMVGMNKWAREAGYPIPARYGDANHIESLYAAGGSDPVNLATIGKDAIDTFTNEGPSGGHYRAIYSQNIHIGIGIATNAQGTAAFFTLLNASPNM